MKRLSPIDAYKLLPKTNCRECGEKTCLAFATKLANRDLPSDKCPPLLKTENRKAYEQLRHLLEPPVREVAVGTGSKAVRIGGKLVMRRHEFAYANPTAIAIEVTDEMPEEQLLSRIARTQQFTFDYIGQTLKLDMIAVRSTSNDPDKYAVAVKEVAANTDLPMIFCSLDPEVLKAGLTAAPGLRPLLYAATKDNWKDMAALALEHRCPLTVFAPNDLDTLRSLTKILLACGVEDLVLDPGTFIAEGLSDTIDNMTMLRRAACELGDALSGYPLIGVPMAAWTAGSGLLEDLIKWREACLAVMLMLRFADVLILHSLCGWVLLPITVLRSNLYTDPRRPASVKAGLREFGKPDENSPVMFTTNFALTYYTVASDIEKAKTDAHLLVVDTDGIAVDSAVAGRRLTAEKIAASLKASGIEDKVKHRKLIIPGKASRLSDELERLSGWQVIVGPKDSSAIPDFLREKWLRPV